MSSSNLKLIYESNTICTQPTIFLLCVFRDENLLLEYFIEYYKSLGVSHFIMINNLSVDGGVEYLKQLKNINLKLYQATESYRDAAYGTTWINELLEKHCVNQYCFVVDADELFYFDRNKFNNLQQLVSNMEYQNCNVAPVTLLDMYPNKTNDDYEKGGIFLDHSPFFDQYNTTYYKNVSTLYTSFVHKIGGVRERVFNKVVCITKFPFFKYNFPTIGLAPGYHFFQDSGVILKDSGKIQLLKEPSVLLHFKFIKPHLGNFFKRRVQLNEDWDNSSEYKSYASMIKSSSCITLYDENYSRKMENPEDLMRFFNPNNHKV